ncbi:uncharacterized protein LOC120145402 [Hibiscus syriacus]|uniref:uncharacterized protein LOC120145402 n=1 Tax=Hibiscus syriacus TaxID=106335 RepID=UPI001921006C|nr:uncharacterized protein LOC120145402 [Hibiscus syriacus]
MLGWEAQIQIQELLELISLGEEVCSAVKRAKSFKGECSTVGKLVNQLSQTMKTLLCCIRSARAQLYLRPLRCILAEVKRHFKLALAVLHKCKRRNFIWRLFTGCNGIQFRELHNCLYASIEDMKWLLSIYVGGRRETPCKELPRYRAWSCIASVKMGRELDDRIKAVDSLSFLAREKDEYKNIVYEEGGVPPLQKLLKEHICLEAQIKVANTLCLLANEKGREMAIVKEMVSTILNRLSRTSPIWDRIEAADLVASIAEHNPEMKEYHLIRENVLWRLVSLLSSADDHTPSSLELQLKLSCSKALLILIRESVRNCSTFTETKGMLCLAKLLRTEKNELQYNCLMIIREITAIAETDEGFRHSTFKSSSPASNAIVDELLRVVEGYDITKLRIPAIESVGSLARSFSVKGSRVISPLVVLLGDTDREVAIKASIALQKFVSVTNHLRSKHSKSIIEFNGIPLLMKLLLNDGDKELQSHGLTLLCHIAIHNDGESNVLINAGALNALRTTGQAVAEEQSELKALVTEAISKLQSNNTEKHEEPDNSPGIIQCITEQSKAFFKFMQRQWKIVLQCLTVYLPENVNLLRKSCKKGISRAKRSLKNRIIRRLKKSNCVEPSSTQKPLMDSWVKEIARKLRVMKKIVKSMEKKEIRRRFGYIIYKLRTGNRTISNELYQIHIFWSLDILCINF